MSTQNPVPYPSGQRVLSPREQLQRARALSCVNGKQQASCQGQIHVAMFFDGIGNNIKIDYCQAPVGKQKPSNIARLFMAARDKPNAGTNLPNAHRIARPHKLPARIRPCKKRCRVSWRSVSR